MQIRLTRKELVDILHDNFNNRITEVVIVREMKEKAPPVAYNILMEMRKHFNTSLSMEEYLRYHPENKIDAIKKLREITKMGLQDSKWVIENWGRWFKWVNESGVIPRIEWRNPTTGEPYIAPLFFEIK